MKNYFKGLISGIILTVLIICIPVVAENISVAFNEFRINANGIDAAQWGESYILANGEVLPYSITYKDTTYLPIRKVSELTGLHIAYNGDSRTVSVSYVPNSEKVLAEKPDANGNVWKYYTFKTAEEDRFYLGVKDEARGYERMYKLLNNNVTVTDDAIYFFRREDVKDDPNLSALGGYPIFGTFRKLSFLNDPNTQDGEVISQIRHTPVLFDGEYLYRAYTIRGLTTTGGVTAYNVFTKEFAEVSAGRGYSISGISLNDEGVAVVTVRTPSGGHEEMFFFDKSTKDFVRK